MPDNLCNWGCGKSDKPLDIVEEQFFCYRALYFLQNSRQPFVVQRGTQSEGWVRSAINRQTGEAWNCSLLRG